MKITIKFLFSLATILPYALSAPKRRNPKCKNVSSDFLYDFEEFDAGDKIKTLGGGDVRLSAKRYSYNKGDLVLRKAIPMAFDTANPTGNDSDLVTADLGMVLITSEDGNASDPDNNEFGGVFTFTFNRNSAIVNKLLVLDSEEGGTLKVFKEKGRTKSFKIPSVKNGGRASIRIGERGVRKMVAKYKGSIAFGWLDVSYCNAKRIFDHSGAAQSFVVPAGVTSVEVKLCGGQGGPNAFNAIPGGLGAEASGTINVTPGEVLEVYVGGMGATGIGGFNGGGDAGNTDCTSARGGGGGGASDIRQGGTGLSNRIIVAAGGGGAGGDRRQSCGPGSGGGGGGGYYGGGGGGGYNGDGGHGGTQSEGGAGGLAGSCCVGVGGGNGIAGSSRHGGDGGVAPSNNQGGNDIGPPGGAGGGLNGQMCGSGSPLWRGGGGGGGSSYIAGIMDGATTPSASVCSGDGKISFSFDDASYRHLQGTSVHVTNTAIFSEKFLKHRELTEPTCPLNNVTGVMVCFPIPDNDLCREKCENWSS